MNSASAGIDLREGPSLLTLGPNLKGNDYFVGDLHGEGRLLAAALQHLSFNWESDRLFAVGDLVDRGDSHEELFKAVIGQPNFYSVLGNHDIDCWAQIQTYLIEGAWPNFEGSEWLRQLRMSDIARIQEFIRGLPLAIKVTLSNGLRIGVVHADVPEELASFSALADISREYLPTVTPKSLINSLILSRRSARAAGTLLLDQIYSEPAPDYTHVHRLLDVGPDLDLIVCGHSICLTFRPVQAGKWIFLDSGAGYFQMDLPDAALSIVDIVKRRVVQARHAEFGTVSTSEFELDDPLPIPSDSSTGTYRCEL